MDNRTIAIDGPAGAGKSTIAKLVAHKLGYTYVDTGAMYRAIAWKILQEQQPVTTELIEAMVRKITLDLHYTPEGNMIVSCDGQDVTKEIRRPEVTALVSQVAAVGAVRHKMVELQRQLAAVKPVVMDGRDIGTCVLPQARTKIFLTASVEERARRRVLDMEKQGYQVDFEQIKQDIARRDQADSEREISPLRQAEDAVLVDTTAMTIEQVVDRLCQLAQG